MKTVAQCVLMASLVVCVATSLHAQDFKKVTDVVGGLESSLKKVTTEDRDQQAEEAASPKSKKASPILATSQEAVGDSAVSPMTGNQTAIDRPGAVSLAIGSDIVSRYVWRGSDFGDAPAFQPYIAARFSGFELGTWGSFAFAAPNGSTPFLENDLYLKHSFTLGAGSFTTMLADFYFPGPGVKFFNFKGSNAGAHTIELSGVYSGTSIPLTITAAVNVHNDTSHSAYVELGYSTTIEEVSLSTFVGATYGESVWYGVSGNKLHIINVGVVASKVIALSQSFSLPVSATFVVNPYTERTQLVFKISL